MVAVVPNDSAATSGCTAPEPSASHCLSPAAAISGVPARTPRCSAAASVSSPSRPVGATSLGSQDRSNGATSHFQSSRLTHSLRLKSNGR